jgi:lipopolysaccharide transport system ATP-binding protein
VPVMDMDGIAISVQDVSKKYHIYAKPVDRLKEYLTLGRKSFHQEFWALRHVSFTVRKGEVLGIIGRNGSGKSTLLQVVCGILSQTSGDVATSGRVSALLTLGAGFNPEFTGRDNVFTYGQIIGLRSEEIEERFQEIADFADIGDFIDQPVRIYSSGMYMRLAFAAAISVDPDILVVDEALAVGDAKFQAKCFRKFEEFQRRNKTILLVTHSTDHLARHCNRAMLLHDGAKISEGEPLKISNEYGNLLFGSTTTSAPMNIKETGSGKGEGGRVSEEHMGRVEVEHFIKEPLRQEGFTSRKSYNRYEFRWGDRSAEIVDYLVLCGEECDPVQCDVFSDFKLYLKVTFHRQVDHPIYGLTIKTVDGVIVCGNNSRDWDNQDHFVAQQAGDGKIVCFSFQPKLVAGDYLLSVGVAEEKAGEVVALDRRYDAIHISFVNPNRSFGLSDLGLKFEYVT